MPQTLLSFEQQTRDAEQATKDAAAQAKADAKAKEESDKSTRRMMRAAAYAQKHPPGHAQCGSRWYPAGSGWTHCHACGQALVYTTDRNAPPQVCAGRRP